ncbi:hypothetical protein ACIQYG_20365 [Peribacillus sp. NPDC096622]|uniref:hypothetical protein n=1 Tax=Peribacillus sp. NPDC096622 TaxID=3364396 RepID=UPI00382B6AB8
MIELIKQIFLESNFTIENNLSEIKNEHYTGFFAKRLANRKFDFFLVLAVNEEYMYLEELDGIMKNHLEQILQTQEYPGVDKNLSMLLLTKRNKIEYTDEFNKKVYDFEENPFRFKKYLLPFTTQQHSLLKMLLDEEFRSQEVILNEEDQVVKQLEKIISNKKWFTLFKDLEKVNGTDEAKIYDLVSKIYIKLPFLKIKVNKEELPNIAQDIKDEISNDDKEIVERILNMENNDPNWNDILSVLGVELDEL